MDVSQNIYAGTFYMRIGRPPRTREAKAAQCAVANRAHVTVAGGKRNVAITGTCVIERGEGAKAMRHVLWRRKGNPAGRLSFAKLP